MYYPHVPYPSSLARQAQLPGLLACEGHSYKLQLQDELFGVELSCPTSQLQQSYSEFQL